MYAFSGTAAADIVCCAAELRRGSPDSMRDRVLPSSDSRSEASWLEGRVADVQAPIPEQPASISVADFFAQIDEQLAAVYQVRP